MNVLDFEHHIFSVSEISNTISTLFEEYFYWINIEGEVTNLNISQNKHIYFSLKDKDSIINVICWSTKSQEVKNQIIEGEKIICSGYLSIYNKNSKYQLIIDSIKTSNKESEFALKFKKLKDRFESKGFFKNERKKIINKIPEKIAIITSEKSAALQDMLHRIKDRFSCKVLLCDIPVQNQTTHKKIIEILKKIDNKKYDAIIIARGGGSQEDFHPFNEESLIIQISKLKTPIVSAIGHETDNTLLDLIADLRAPTPTAAIEILLPTRTDIENKIANNFNNTKITLKQKIVFYNLKISNFGTNKNLVQYKLDVIKNIVNQKLSKMNHNIKIKIEETKNKIIRQKLILGNYNSDKILKMGYVIIRQKKLIITSKELINKNQIIQIQFHDGKISTINTQYKNEQF